MQQRLQQLRQDLANAKQRCDQLRDQLAQVHQQTSRTILQETSNAHTEPFEIVARRTCTGHFGKIYALNWNSRSEFLVTAAQDGRLIIWRANRGTAIAAIPLRSSWVMTCAFAVDDNFTASGGLDNTVSLYKVSSDGADRKFTEKDLERELEIHEGYVSCARFRDRQHVMSASGDGTCCMSDFANSKTVMRWIEHTGDVMSLALNPMNEQVFASGSIDATVRIWDIRQENGQASFHGHESDVNSVAWMGDGHCILSGSDDSSVRLFDDRSFRQLMQYEKKDEPAGVAGITSVDVSSTGKRVFAALDNGHVFVYETMTGARVQDVDHPQRVSSLGVSPSGQALATGCWDFNLRVYAP